MADRPAVQVTEGTVAHAGILSQMHRACFVDGWSPKSMASLLVTPGTFALIAVDKNESDTPIGFMFCRVADVECEILTIGIMPDGWRLGMGTILLKEGLRMAESKGAKTAFLEVAKDNVAAVALYRSAGFSEFGIRENYYKRPIGRIDALVFRRPLESQ